MVKRLVDYKWSRYTMYAYARPSPEWLMVDALLSQFSGKDRNKAYREMVQDYSKEEKRIWEDFHHGLLFGSREFCATIKSKYISKKPNSEIPQKRLLLREENLNTMVRKAAPTLGVDISDITNSSRISGTDKDKRDVLIYLLWNTGLYKNHEIGKIFNLSYSSVSKQVTNTKSRLNEEAQIKKMFIKANSVFKM